jgi:hypothetical protein
MPSSRRSFVLGSRSLCVASSQQLRAETIRSFYPSPTKSESPLLPEDAVLGESWDRRRARLTSRAGGPLLKDTPHTSRINRGCETPGIIMAINGDGRKAEFKSVFPSGDKEVVASRSFPWRIDL